MINSLRVALLLVLFACGTTLAYAAFTPSD